MAEKVIIRPCLLQGENDLSDETSLYKYLSIEAFLYLIEFKRLIFSRITTWPDAYEGSRFEFFKRLERDQEFADKQKDDFYGSCWSFQSEDKRLYEDIEDYNLSIKELIKNGSASMWESYCKNGGVRIRTTLEKLNELFSAKIENCKLFRGKAYYEAEESWTKTIKASDLISTLFMKRISFRHESEYRYFLVSNKSRGDKIVTVEIDDLYDFIDEILVAPAIPSNTWISRTLYHIGVDLSINSDRGGVNSKNGKQFCRISQLYGLISEVVGHYDMT